MAGCHEDVAVMGKSQTGYIKSDGVVIVLILSGSYSTLTSHFFENQDISTLPSS